MQSKPEPDALYTHGIEVIEVLQSAVAVMMEQAERAAKAPMSESVAVPKAKVWDDDLEKCVKAEALEREQRAKDGVTAVPEGTSVDEPPESAETASGTGIDDYEDDEGW